MGEFYDIISTYVYTSHTVNIYELHIPFSTIIRCFSF